MLENIVQDKLKNFTMYTNGHYIAGGAIRSVLCNEEINDIDLYPKNFTAALELLYDVTTDGSAVIHLSDKAVTFLLNDVKYQIVLGEFKSPEDIFEKFDFTNCMASYDCDSKEVTFHKDFVAACLSRSLRYNPNTMYPYCSMRRVHKFTKRGWTISNSEQFKIAHSCPEINSWDELKKHLGGFYGTKVDIPKDVEFSHTTMYDALDSLRDVMGYDACSTATANETLLHLAACFGFPGATYDDIIDVLQFDGTDVTLKVSNPDTLPRTVKRVGTSDISIPEGDNIYFKAVKSTKIAGEYTSWFKEDFIYKTNETAIADSPRGLFVLRTFKEAVTKMRMYDMDTVIAVATKGPPLRSITGELKFKELTPTGWEYKINNNMAV